MPIGLTVNNPQEQNPVAALTPTAGGPSITFGGNLIGSGSTSTTASNQSDLSTILTYGAIGLFIVLILDHLDK